MKSLFIDTHLFDINILLFENEKVLKHEQINDKKQNSCFLMPTIKKICDSEKIDQIIVVNGPGSFTGVRLGVTIAKTMAYCLNIPIKTISYLEMMFISNEKKAYYGLSDNNGYFIANFNENDNIEYRYLNNTDYRAFITSQEVITDVSIDYEKIASVFNKLDDLNPHEVKPLYIKLIGVEYDKKTN